MTKSLIHMMNALPAARRKRIEKRGQELIKEQLTLQQLRKELNLTQDAMAELLEMKQANVSKVEKRTDMLISTLRNKYPPAKPEVLGLAPQRGFYNR